MTTTPVKAEAFNKTVWRVETSAGVYEVRAGVAVGLTYGLAWKLAYVNDEGGPYDETPEQRYERVLAWVRDQRVTSRVAA